MKSLEVKRGSRFNPPRKKFKLNRSALLVFLAILLSSVGFLAYKFLLPQLKLQTYNQGSVHFRYPRDWEIWEGSPEFSKHMPTAPLLFVKKDRQSTSFGIRTEEMEGSKLNIEKSLPVLEERLKSVGDFEKVGYKNSTVSGEKVIDYTFKYSLKEAQGAGGGWSKWYGVQRQVIFFKSGTLYYLIFTSEPEDFEKDSRDFDLILKSFEIF